MELLKRRRYRINGYYFSRTLNNEDRSAEDRLGKLSTLSTIILWINYISLNRFA